MKEDGTLLVAIRATHCWTPQLKTTQALPCRCKNCCAATSIIMSFCFVVNSAIKICIARAAASNVVWTTGVATAMCQILHVNCTASGRPATSSTCASLDPLAVR